MEMHMTLDQIEKMKTHELADLLANVVLLLRRLPNVECKQLIQQDNTYSQPQPPIVAPEGKSFSRDELVKRKVDDLKLLAKEMNVLFSKTTKKDELINKILARSVSGRSEQRAILDM